MLTYRALLVDTAAIQERPVQAICANVKQVDAWTRAILRKANKDAYVVVYRVNEIEIGSIKKSDLYDKGSISNLQPAGEEASQPAT